MGICVCNEEQRKYFIAVATSQDNPEFEEYTIPATIWAIFPGIGTNKWLLCLADKKAELPRKHINIFWKVRLLCYVPGRIRTAGLQLRSSLRTVVARSSIILLGAFNAVN